MQEWDVYVVHEVRDWIDALDAETHARVVQAIDVLADAGPQDWAVRLWTP